MSPRIAGASGPDATPTLPSSGGEEAESEGDEVHASAGDLADVLDEAADDDVASWLDDLVSPRWAGGGAGHVIVQLFFGG